MPTLRLTVAVAPLLILCACAGSKGNVKPDAPVTSAHQDIAGCLRGTGSHIPTSGGGCSAFGRSYSSEDINRTGYATAGGALRLLDPTVTIH
jgi:hypothetical protein